MSCASRVRCSAKNISWCNPAVGREGETPFSIIAESDVQFCQVNYQPSLTADTLVVVSRSSKICFRRSLDNYGVHSSKLSDRHSSYCRYHTLRQIRRPTRTAERSMEWVFAIVEETGTKLNHVMLRFVTRGSVARRSKNLHRQPVVLATAWNILACVVLFNISEKLEALPPMFSNLALVYRT